MKETQNNSKIKIMDNNLAIPLNLFFSPGFSG